MGRRNIGIDGLQGRLCCRCKKVKSFGDFSKDKNNPKGLHRECKDCISVRQKIYYQRNKKQIKMRTKENHKRRRLDPEYRKKERVQRSQKLIKKYGITLDDYDEMFTQQNGLCAICNEPQKAIHGISNVPLRLFIDHNHKTGKVRGLLCSSCNLWLGALENKTFLQKAKKYLRRFR